MSNNKRISISLYKFEGKSEDITSIYSSISEKKYKENTDYGFIDINLVNEYFTSTLVYRVPTFTYQAGIDGELLKAESFYYVKCDFAIDFKLKILEAYCSEKNQKYLFSSLRETIGHSKSDTVNTTPSLVYPLLQNNLEKFNVEKMLIRNFRHNDYLIGKYSATVKSNDEAEKIINIYNHDIVKLKVNFYNEAYENVDLTFTEGGKIILYCNEKYTFELIDFIKNIIIN